jgi:uncharacterized protein
MDRSNNMNQGRVPSRRRYASSLKHATLALVAATIALVSFSWYMGGKLSASANHAVGPAPESLHASYLTFPSESGSTIHAWLSLGTPGRGTVLLLHGVRSDRSSMLGRALFLHDLGYSVLLIDLQAHGESRGERITLGHLESRDVIAAREFLRSLLPDEPVAVIGVSLGAAAVTLCDGKAAFDAVVLESMYPTIIEAVEDRLRLRLGAPGTLLAPLLTAQLQPRLGIDVEQLRPIDHIESLQAPLLLIHGTLDQHTLIDEAKAIFAKARQPKQFWKISGAAHVDLHRFAGREYERRVGEFIDKHLHPRETAIHASPGSAR